MSQIDAVRQVTIRLPPDLLQDARRIAKSRNISLNRLVCRSLERAAQEEQRAVLRASYDLLGRDDDEADVERFRSSQGEVVSRG